MLISFGRSISPVRSAWDIDARLTGFLDLDRLGGQRCRRRGAVVLAHVGRELGLLLESA